MADPIQINVSDYDLVRSRQELVLGMGLDTKRPTAWQQYGWPDETDFAMLQRAYTRGGPGYGAVHRLLERCWQDWPRFKQPKADKPTAWEEKVGKLLQGINGWQKLRDLDRRNMVGRYAALIYRVGDGGKLSEPLVKATRLVDLVPVFEDQIRVTKWDENQDSESYGQPQMFQIRTRSPEVQRTDSQAQPETWLDVHPTRVQILAEGSVGNMFEGVPLLKAGYNDLVNLEKISGGSAEGFLKNSARTVVFAYDVAAQPQVIGKNADGTEKSVREAHEEQTRKLNKNQDSSIVMQGGKADTLKTDVGDPTGPFETSANLFACSVQIPFTILFGQQTGRLASDEDQKDMNARCKSRRTNTLTPMLTEFVKRMQAAGLIDEGEFEVEWQPLDAPGDTEKADLLGKYTTAMKQAFDSGLAMPLFDQNELRGVVGFEEREDDGLPTEDELKQGMEAEQAALAARAAGAKPGAKPAPKA